MVDQKTDFPALLQFLIKFYEEKIPFNKVFNLQITYLKEDNICIKIDMKDELIGNCEYRMLHGGVISSVLDLTGGAIASMGVLKKLEGRPLKEITKRLYKIGTIDLRVDFLRPGRGKLFFINRVHNAHGKQSCRYTNFSS